MHRSQAISTNYDFTTNSCYRYGFNGKESDDEVKGSTGTQYDYGFRIYDPRIAKFLSVDPLTKSYPELTPYQFASNTPIQAIDLDGLEAAQFNEVFINSQGNEEIRRVVELNIFLGVSKVAESIHYKSADIEVIKDNLNNEYNNKGFTTEDGTSVLFRFKVSTFDADNLTSSEASVIERRNKSNYFESTDGNFYFNGGTLEKGSVKKVSGKIGAGVTQFKGQDRKTTIDKGLGSKSEESHNQAHEIFHQFNFLQIVKDKVDDHRKDGISKYGAESEGTVESVNQKDVNIILKNTPEKK